ncbi:sterol O-acyltransferase 1-like [Hetaerina americana]|uniref:sterol O-acyltransferase 1-like n=1 Tax=Hetaerina americana TaxID=62018 RepID=UPI003A7F585E
MAAEDGAVKPADVAADVVITCVETKDAVQDFKSPAEQRRYRHKQFKVRNSVLTDLYKISHIKTIYNAFTASFILLFINIVVNDIAEHNSFQRHLDLIAWHFDGMLVVTCTWLLMFGATLVFFGFFKMWAYVRVQLQSSKLLRHSFDLMCVGAYAIYLLVFLCGPPALILRGDLAPVTTTLLVIEQLRMMMKSHAFVRSNLRNVIGKKGAKETRAEDVKLDRPTFKQFLYFHIAPTLVYRDSYPRTDRVRWKIVTWHLCEAVGICFYSSITFEQFLHGHLLSFWDEPLSFHRILALFFRSLFPGLMFLILCFYVFFHAWMNAWAEILRFGDRLFYKDWWTTTTFSDYYRSWNLIVHDWIYEYLYLDMVKKFSRAEVTEGTRPSPRRGSNYAIKALVFFVSALFHEYVSALSVRFLYPVLFLLFGIIGVALMLVQLGKGAIGNIFMWLSLSTGVAILLTAYSIEYYARKTCMPIEDAILDVIIPRSVTCNSTLILWT